MKLTAIGHHRFMPINRFKGPLYLPAVGTDRPPLSDNHDTREKTDAAGAIAGLSLAIDFVS